MALGYNVGSLADALGKRLGLPEFGISERLAGQATRNTQNIPTITAPRPSVPTVYGPNSGGQVKGVSTQSGGGGGNNSALAAAYSQPTQVPDLSGIRQSAEDSNRRQLEAALGVFEAQKQKTLNRIPGVKEAAGLRIKGLEQGLENFNTTAQQEEAKRIAGLQGEAQQINETYTAAGRQTRNAAQSLEKSLRNRFASLGTLDSTQYRDMNIEQSRDIAQSLGDTQREKAGKLTANTREGEDLKQFYATQRLQEQQRVQLEKEKVQADTDSLVQSIIDDANISDAQKIEAIQQAQGRLDARMADLDMQEANLKAGAAENDRTMAIKLAELQNKGTSASYKSVVDNRKALEDMAGILEGYRNQDDGSLALTRDGIKKVASTVGFPEEELDQVADFFGVPVRRKQDKGSSSTNNFGWEAN